MEVEASIDAPLIFAGDVLEAKVIFRPKNSGTDSKESSHTPIHLLSGSAYIQGTFRAGDDLNQEKLEILQKGGPGNYASEVNGKHAHTGGLFGEVWGGLRNLVIRGSQDEDDGYPIFNTPQYLLFTDISITESRSFSVSTPLPISLPPTYRSKSLAISYDLVVSFQTLSDKGAPAASELTLPFKVYPFIDAQPHDLMSPLTQSSSPVTTLKTEDLNAYVDKILAGEREATPDIPSPLKVTTDTSTSKVSYNFSKEGVTLASLILARPAVHLGDFLFGVLRFAVPCYSVSAYLEAEEDITPDFLNPGAVPKTYKVFSKQSAGVLGLEEISLHLAVPPSATPNFKTKQMGVNWCLRLEIVQSPGKVLEKQIGSDAYIAKATVETDFISTRIPLTVLAPNNGGHSVSKTWSFH